MSIKEFAPQSKPTVERLKCATVDGFTILVGIESEPGLYVYFPAGCKINPEFLRYNNLFRHTELNTNPDKSGMFDENGRVKAIKLQAKDEADLIIEDTPAVQEEVITNTIKVTATVSQLKDLNDFCVRNGIAVEGVPEVNTDELPF